MKIYLPRQKFAITSNYKLIKLPSSKYISNRKILSNQQGTAQEDYDSSTMSRAQVEEILQEMLYADSRSSMQVNAIMRQLKQLMLDKSEEEDYQVLEEDSTELAEKRAIRALMRGNGKPDIGGKRSIGILAKNGQLPSKDPESDSSSWLDTEKRNLASILRSGVKSGKRSVSSMARQYQLPNVYGKRNFAALMRSGMIPSASYPKRNLAALVRATSYQGKRNVGALARDWVLPKTTQKYDGMDKGTLYILNLI